MVKMERFKQMFRQINEYGYTDDGMNRLAYSKEEAQALQYIKRLCEAEGLLYRQDEIGNVIIRREGTDPSLPAVAVGSHIDTVYNGGMYDGTVGVLAGLEVLFALNEEKVRTTHPLEVIIFACEESARFGLATVGSKAMVGTLDLEEVMRLHDENDQTFTEVIAQKGFSLEYISMAERNEDELKAFLELHIEQGPVLEGIGKDIGLVTGIAAPTRYHVTIHGRQSHSGSTPMRSRQDALLAASEFALYLEQLALEEEDAKTVATVGACKVKSGAMNIVPGEVKLHVDIRSIYMESKERLIENLHVFVKKLEKKRDVQVSFRKITNETPVLLNERLLELAKSGCEKRNFTYEEMPSGAGHDAMNMALKYPTGVIFIPSKDGLSHHPDEYTSFKQIEKGIHLLKDILCELAIFPELYKL